MTSDQTKLGQFPKTFRNCEVVDIPAGALPKYISVRLKGPDGAVVDAWWDGFPSLAVGRFVKITRNPDTPQYEVAGTSGGTASIPAAHALLSEGHSDTLADTVVSGDILYGNATPEWARRAKGADGEVLTLVSGLPDWVAPSGTWPYTHILTVSPTNINAQYTTIALAYAAASAGDAIWIDPGTYAETLTIAKAIYIFAIQGSVTISDTLTITAAAYIEGINVTHTASAARGYVCSAAAHLIDCTATISGSSTARAVEVTAGNVQVSGGNYSAAGAGTSYEVYVSGGSVVLANEPTLQGSSTSGNISGYFLNITGGLVGVGLTASRALTTNGSKVLASSAVTTTELGYVSGVTSAIQTQIDGKVPSTRTISTTSPLAGGGDLSADRTLTVGAASESASGVAELATQTETDAGTDDARIVTPLKAFTAAYRREKLTAARTYYVRTDGSDSNTGLVNSAGGAFLTWQKPIDTATAFDLNGYTVTINIGDGTYNITTTVTTKTFVGGGSIALVGNASTPANVLLRATSAVNIFTMAHGPCSYTLDGMKFDTNQATGIQAIKMNSQSLLTCSNINFGAMSSSSDAGQHMNLDEQSIITWLTGYTVSGRFLRHFNLAGLSLMTCINKTITISGTVSGTHWAYMYGMANCDYYGNTFSGSLTAGCTRFDVSFNATLRFGGVTLPGSVAGATSNGGVAA